MSRSRSAAIGRIHGRAPTGAHAWVGRRLAPINLALVVFFAASEPLAAAVIPVDGFDGTVADDGTCTLIEAVTAANADAASGLLAGECPAGSGADTIVLTGDVILGAVHSSDTGTPAVTSRITVRGNGHTIERSSVAGTPEFRILHVASDGDLTLRDVTIRNGMATSPTIALPLGGGILSEGVLRLTDCIVVSNSARYGGGIASEGSASVDMTRCLVADNEATVNGGGAYLRVLSPTTIRSSTFALNRAGEKGGGLLMAASTGTVERSTFWGNTAQYGGAIQAVTTGLWAFLRVVNSTMFGNSATEAGGAIATVPGTPVTLLNSTLWENPGGGPLALAGGSVYNAIDGVTTITNSLVGVSTGVNCHGLITSIVDGGNNLVTDASCGSIPAAVISGFDTTLSGNGGPTMTHRLLTRSNAIDAAGSCGLLTDQRGALRDGSCDVGAYEYRADDEFESAGSGSSDDSCVGHHVQLGRWESHLHTEDAEDWLWFQPAAGSTYEIETGGLIGGSDTVLELWRGCASQLRSDDNGGPGSASKITYTAVGADVVEGLDVRVRDVDGSDAYRGYFVAVSCVGGSCGGCPLGGGADFVLSDETLVTQSEIEACNSIVVLDTRVASGAAAILRAGSSVELQNGFEVGADGSLVVEIDPDLQ